MKKRIVLLLTTIALVTTSTFDVFAVTKSEAQQQKNEAQKSLNQINNNIENLEENKEEVQEEIIEIDNQLVDLLLTVDLVTEDIKNKEKIAYEREQALQKTIVRIQKRYGKNMILKGMNFQANATTIERNGQIGGHKL